MKKVLAALAIALIGGLLTAQELKYRPAVYDSTLEALKDFNEEIIDQREAETDRIRDFLEEQSELDRIQKQVLAIDWSDIRIPESPADFQQVWHFPPTRQYLTGACWSFATTSFLEAEVNRLYGKKIKMSEMFTVYHEYLLKTSHFVAERGEKSFGQGSEANAVTRIWRQFGAIPRNQYPGVLAEDGLFNHKLMYKEIDDYLEWVSQADLWDEESVLNTVRVIMHRYLGQPPEHFIYDGIEYRPTAFLEEVLWLDMDDYVNLLSTSKFPFYSNCEFQVPDNWWESGDYFNLPLDDFYAVLKTALDNGYSVLLGGDVSEPGLEGAYDSAVIPVWDIPPDEINQAARELRFYNEATTDDHLLHAVGYTRIGRDDWFLVKDSGSGAYRGKHAGYMFYRGDYVRLKTLTLTVHRDIVVQLVKDYPLD